MSNPVALMLYGDTVRAPELRHEVPLTIADPFLFVEIDDRRVVVIGELETPRLERLDGLEIWPAEAFGIVELRAETSLAKAAYEVVRRACEKLGVAQAVVPDGFPLALARALEAGGIALEARDDVFTRRRRRKSDAELKGILSAQRASDAAMARVRELLDAADASGEIVSLDGVPLSSERLRGSILEVLRGEDMDLDELIVSHGAQTAIGHETGHGEIRPGEPIIVDIWPRDRATACHTDMTRTFVCGEPTQLLLDQRCLCVQAMEIALALVMPGAATFAVYAAVCEFFEQQGCWTPLTHDRKPGAASKFPYALGHGVGLELHEEPVLSRGYHSTFVEGDVLALEPALYVDGVGGCRIEDIVLVREDGCERLTRCSYHLGSEA